MGTIEIIVTISLLLLGILIGLYLIVSFDSFSNAIKKLKINSIYFQDEPGPSDLLLRESSETAKLKLYKINGVDRRTMPQVFAVTDKKKGLYTIVPYKPIIVGGTAKDDLEVEDTVS